MVRCWAPSLKERPSFTDIVHALGELPSDSKVWGRGSPGRAPPPKHRQECWILLILHISGKSGREELVFYAFQQKKKKRKKQTNKWKNVGVRIRLNVSMEMLIICVGGVLSSARVCLNHSMPRPFVKSQHMDSLWPHPHPPTRSSLGLWLHSDPTLFSNHGMYPTLTPPPPSPSVMMYCDSAHQASQPQWLLPLADSRPRKWTTRERRRSINTRMWAEVSDFHFLLPERCSCVLIGWRKPRPFTMSVGRVCEDINTNILFLAKNWISGVFLSVSY